MHKNAAYTADPFRMFLFAKISFCVFFPHLIELLVFIGNKKTAQNLSAENYLRAHLLTADGCREHFDFIRPSNVFYDIEAHQMHSRPIEMFLIKPVCMKPFGIKTNFGFHLKLKLIISNPI